jgi:hypothetical protein
MFGFGQKKVTPERYENLVQKEQREHPQLTEDEARQIVNDHIKARDAKKIDSVS